MAGQFIGRIGLMTSTVILATAVACGGPNNALQGDKSTVNTSRADEDSTPIHTNLVPDLRVQQLLNTKIVPEHSKFKISSGLINSKDYLCWLSESLAYSVTIVNETTEILTLVSIFWSSKDGTLREPRFINEVPPATVHAVALGPCEDMGEYAIGVFIGKKMVPRFPAQGAMRPEDVSRYHPADNHPCMDSWVITSTG
jgi:hypothetical protein